MATGGAGACRRRSSSSPANRRPTTGSRARSPRRGGRRTRSAIARGSETSRAPCTARPIWPAAFDPTRILSPVITIRRAEERGHADHGWLDTRHTFSFADYYDERYMGFRGLRVINEDRVQPGQGFPTHGHRDMEIVSYVLAGALEHKDSMGTGSVIRPGDVQRMSAGTGVLHSEYNHSRDEPVHFLQIWIVPERRGLPPSYEQKHFPEADRRGRFRLIASRDGADGSLVIHCDARLYTAILDAGQKLDYPLGAGRHAWLQVARGAVALDGAPFRHGDGAAGSGEPALTVTGQEPAEILLFDLA